MDRHSPMAQKKPSWLLFAGLVIMGLIVLYLIIGGITSKKPDIPNHVSLEGDSKRAVLYVGSEAGIAEAKKHQQAQIDQLNGVPTGDSYVLIVFSYSSVPDTGKLYRDNARLEQLGFMMDPNSLRIAHGDCANSITAVYHKKK